MSNTVKLIIAVIVIAGVLVIGYKMTNKDAGGEGMAPTSEMAPAEEPSAMDSAADTASDAADAVGKAASDAADAVGEAASDAGDAISKAADDAGEAMSNAGSDDTAKENAGDMQKDGAAQ
jgi:hypothetical protein